jgi:hypothetical protein
MSLAAAELVRHVYRPWIRETGIEDFGVADSVMSLIGAALPTFAVAAIAGRDSETSTRIATGVAVGAMSYEFLQPILGTGTFDWGDVAAGIIGAIAALLMVRLIWLKSNAA